MKKLVLIILSVFTLLVILSVIGFRSIIWTASPNVAAAPKTAEKIRSFKTISHLYIKANTPVLLKSSNNNDIRVKSPIKTQLEKHGSTLNVVGVRHWHKQVKILGFHPTKTHPGSLIITIPNNQSLKSLDLDVQESDNKTMNAPVVIQNIKTDNLSFDGNAHLFITDSNIKQKVSVENILGQTELTEDNIDHGSVSNELGSVTLNSNHFKKLDIDDELGNIRFNNQQVEKEFTANSELGSVKGIIDHKKNANVTTTTEMGFNSLFGHSKHHYTGYDKHLIKYDLGTELGNVKVQ
ncbi:DUF4097 family beta strand repeat-containing protein [Lentilactobacillus sp. Marseille-Q4993]|uniref:DUF4097 family beta strand repeat-containing protein n=1 Tax=Lentilactobacillus sp. Marseille-Q4993 TaxID=3039492 RepID=UPI0024BC6068|nr:DUF4097 family beta strand repeat-containing protein [Lentilactobacillus sp. Marseille-Q4993]